uniref:E3 ubiquitin/ISG15 ligase TRIM25-like n=1 Tax=Leptobrachium leishanense TaxID=445787 RepID=A0A8C5WB34_9ANUR
MRGSSTRNPHIGASQSERSLNETADRFSVMASAELRDELTCCICTDIYTDPVTLTCGHSFCRLCITRTWDKQEEREYSCPECIRRFRVKPELKRALRLSNIAERFRSAHPEPEEVGILCTYCDSPVRAAKTCLMCEASLCDKHLKKHSRSVGHVLTEPNSALGNRKCSVHKEILKYYCCEDAACICLSCTLSGEHRGHQVETLNEVCEKKKEKLRNILEKLTSDREETEKRVHSLQELRNKVQEKAVGVTGRVTALIRDIREQLRALEKRVLKEISRQEEKALLKISDLIQQLEIKKEELSRKIGDIEELCNMMDPVTVLKGQESDRADYNEDTERHDLNVHDTGDLDVGLISVTLHSGLAGIVTRAKRGRHVLETSDISMELKTASDMLLDVNTAPDMLLDVNTAANNVSVSQDLKTVARAAISQSRPETPERFQFFPQVLTSRSFSSGRHYWELEGSESGGWEFGMAYSSIDRTGKQSGIGNKSWGLERRFKTQYYVINDSDVNRLPRFISCQRIGILLDYEAGRLSFYELCDPIRHLHTFTATFTEPLHAVFGIYWDKAWVRI